MPHLLNLSYGCTSRSFVHNSHFVCWKCKIYRSLCFSCFLITFEDASLCLLRDELHKRDIIFDTWWDDWMNHSYRSTSFPAVVVVVDVVFVICCFFFPSFLSQLYIYLLQVSLINFVASLVGAGGIQAFKTMRTLRALRPLRAMSRMQGMRVCTHQSQGTLEEYHDPT